MLYEHVYKVLTTTFRQFRTPSHFHTMLLVGGKGHQHAAHQNTLSFYIDLPKMLNGGILAPHIHMQEAMPQFAFSP